MLPGPSISAAAYIITCALLISNQSSVSLDVDSQSLSAIATTISPPKIWNLAEQSNPLPTTDIHDVGWFLIQDQKRNNKRNLGFNIPDSAVQDEVKNDTPLSDIKDPQIWAFLGPYLINDTVYYMIHYPYQTDNRMALTMKDNLEVALFQMADPMNPSYNQLWSLTPA